MVYCGLFSQETNACFKTEPGSNQYLFSTDREQDDIGFYNALGGFKSWSGYNF